MNLNSILSYRLKVVSCMVCLIFLFQQLSWANPEIFQKNTLQPLTRVTGADINKNIYDIASMYIDIGLTGRENSLSNKNVPRIRRAMKKFIDDMNENKKIPKDISGQFEILEHVGKISLGLGNIKIKYFNPNLFDIDAETKQEESKGFIVETKIIGKYLVKQKICRDLKESENKNIIESIQKNGVDRENEGLKEFEEIPEESKRLANKIERLFDWFKGFLFKKSIVQFSLWGLLRKMERSEIGIPQLYKNYIEMKYKKIKRIYEDAGLYLEAQHAIRVAMLSVLIYAKIQGDMSKSFEELDGLVTAALAHDLGKIDKEIASLLKNGRPLTAEETELMETHAHKSIEVLKANNIPINTRIENAIIEHSESNIQDTPLDLMSQIIYAADQIDARHDKSRSYKNRKLVNWKKRTLYDWDEFRIVCVLKEKEEKGWIEKEIVDVVEGLVRRKDPLYRRVTTSTYFFWDRWVLFLRNKFIFKPLDLDSVEKDKEHGPVMFIDIQNNMENRSLKGVSEDPKEIPEHEALNQALGEMRERYLEDDGIGGESDGGKFYKEKGPLLDFVKGFSFKTDMNVEIYIVDDNELYDSVSSKGHPFLANGLITHAGTYRDHESGFQNAPARAYNLFVPASIYNVLLDLLNTKDDDKNKGIFSRVLELWRIHELGHLINRKVDLDSNLCNEMKRAAKIIYLLREVEDAKEKAFEVDPSKKDIDVMRMVLLILKIEDLIEKGKFKEAESKVQVLQKNLTRSWYIWNLIAGIQENLGKDQDALKNYYMAMLQFNLRVNEGNIFSGHPAARKYLKLAEKKDARELAALYERFKSFLKNFRKVKYKHLSGVDITNKIAIPLFSELFFILTYLGMNFGITGEIDPKGLKLLENFEKIISTRKVAKRYPLIDEHVSTELYHRLAEFYAKNGDYDHALICLAKTKRIHRTINILSELLFAGLTHEMPDKTRKNYLNNILLVVDGNELLYLDNEKNAKYLANTYYLMGETCIYLGKYERAIEFLDQAVDSKGKIQLIHTFKFIENRIKYAKVMHENENREIREGLNTQYNDAVEKFNEKDYLKCINILKNAFIETRKVFYLEKFLNLIKKSIETLFREARYSDLMKLKKLPRDFSKMDIDLSENNLRIISEAKSLQEKTKKVKEAFHGGLYAKALDICETILKTNPFASEIISMEKECFEKVLKEAATKRLKKQNDPYERKIANAAVYIDASRRQATEVYISKDRKERALNSLRHAEDEIGDLKEWDVLKEKAEEKLGEIQLERNRIKGLLVLEELTEKELDEVFGRQNNNKFRVRQKMSKEVLPDVENKFTGRVFHSVAEGQENEINITEEVVNKLTGSKGIVAANKDQYLKILEGFKNGNSVDVLQLDGELYRVKALTRNKARILAWRIGQNKFLVFKLDKRVEDTYKLRYLDAIKKSLLTNNRIDDLVEKSIDLEALEDKLVNNSGNKTLKSPNSETFGEGENDDVEYVDNLVEVLVSKDKVIEKSELFKAAEYIKAHAPPVYSEDEMNSEAISSKTKIYILNGELKDQPGIPRFPGAKKPSEFLYVYMPEKYRFNSIKAYVTRAYYENYLKNNTAALAELIDHEFVERTLGLSHRFASSRARFFIEDGKLLSPFHNFYINQLIKAKDYDAIFNFSHQRSVNLEIKNHYSDEGKKEEIQYIEKYESLFFDYLRFREWIDKGSNEQNGNILFELCLRVEALSREILKENPEISKIEEILTVSENKIYSKLLKYRYFPHLYKKSDRINIKMRETSINDLADYDENTVFVSEKLNKRGVVAFKGERNSRAQISEFVGKRIAFNLRNGEIFQIWGLSASNEIIGFKQMKQIFETNGDFRRNVYKSIYTKEFDELGDCVIKEHRLDSDGTLSIGGKERATRFGRKYANCKAKITVTAGQIDTVKIFDEIGKCIKKAEYVLIYDYEDKNKLVGSFHNIMSKQRLNKNKRCTLKRFFLDSIGSLKINVIGDPTPAFTKFPNHEVEIDILDGHIDKVRILDKNSEVVKEVPFKLLYDKRGKDGKVIFSYKDIVEEDTFSKLTGILKRLKTTNKGDIQEGNVLLAKESKHKNKHAEAEIEKGMPKIVKFFTNIKKNKLEGNPLKYKLIYDKKSGELIDFFHLKYSKKKRLVLKNATVKQFYLPGDVILRFGEEKWVTLGEYKKHRIAFDVENGVVTEVRVFNKKGNKIKTLPFSFIMENDDGKIGKLVDSFYEFCYPERLEKLTNHFITGVSLDENGGPPELLRYLSGKKTEYIGKFKGKTNQPVILHVKKGKIHNVMELDGRRLKQIVLLRKNKKVPPGISNGPAGVTLKAPGTLAFGNNPKDSREYTEKLISELTRERKEIILQDENLEALNYIKQKAPEVKGVEFDPEKISLNTEITIVDGLGDMMGFPRFEGAERPPDLLCVYQPEMSIDGKVRAYITREYYEKQIKGNVNALAELLDHEYSEQVLHLSHRMAASRSVFFAKTNRNLSPFHDFFIDELDQDEKFELAMNLKKTRELPEGLEDIYALREDNAARITEYEENFFKELKSRLFDAASGGSMFQTDRLNKSYLAAENRDKPKKDYAHILYQKYVVDVETGKREIVDMAWASEKDVKALADMDKEGFVRFAPGANIIKLFTIDAQGKESITSAVKFKKVFSLQLKRWVVFIEGIASNPEIKGKEGRGELRMAAWRLLQQIVKESQKDMLCKGAVVAYSIGDGGRFFKSAVDLGFQDMEVEKVNIEVDRIVEKYYYLSSEESGFFINNVEKYLMRKSCFMRMEKVGNKGLEFIEKIKEPEDYDPLKLDYETLKSNAVQMRKRINEKYFLDDIQKNQIKELIKTKCNEMLEKLKNEMDEDSNIDFNVFRGISSGMSSLNAMMNFMKVIGEMAVDKYPDANAGIKKERQNYKTMSIGYANAILHSLRTYYLTLEWKHLNYKDDKLDASMVVETLKAIQNLDTIDDMVGICSEVLDKNISLFYNSSMDAGVKEDASSGKTQFLKAPAAHKMNADEEKYIEGFIGAKTLIKQSKKVNMDAVVDYIEKNILQIDAGGKDPEFEFNDMPDKVRVKVLFGKDVDNKLGIPRFKGAESPADHIYVYPKLTDGILNLYVTYEFYSRFLENNIPAMAEIVDHEYVERILGYSHRFAASRARFFSADKTSLSPFHEFYINLLDNEDIPSLMPEVEKNRTFETIRRIYEDNGYDMSAILSNIDAIREYEHRFYKAIVKKRFAKYKQSEAYSPDGNSGLVLSISGLGSINEGDLRDRIADRILNETSEKARILSIGCGTGIFERCLIEKDFEVTGVEMTPELVKKARKRGINVLEGDAESVSLWNKLYDHPKYNAVIFPESMVYLNAEEVLFMAKKVLVTGGKIFILYRSPDPKSSREAEKRYSDALKDNGYEVYSKRAFFGEYVKVDMVSASSVEQKEAEKKVTCEISKIENFKDKVYEKGAMRIEDGKRIKVVIEKATKEESKKFMELDGGEYIKYEPETVILKLSTVKDSRKTIRAAVKFCKVKTSQNRTFMFISGIAVEQNSREAYSGTMPWRLLREVVRESLRNPECEGRVVVYIAKGTPFDKAKKIRHSLEQFGFEEYYGPVPQEYNKKIMTKFVLNPEPAEKFVDIVEEYLSVLSQFTIMKKIGEKGLELAKEEGLEGIKDQIESSFRGLKDIDAIIGPEIHGKKKILNDAQRSLVRDLVKATVDEILWKLSNETGDSLDGTIPYSVLFEVMKDYLSGRKATAYFDKTEKAKEYKNMPREQVMFAQTFATTFLHSLNAYFTCICAMQVKRGDEFFNPLEVTGVLREISKEETMIEDMIRISSEVLDEIIKLLHEKTISDEADDPGKASDIELNKDEIIDNFEGVCDRIKELLMKAAVSEKTYLVIDRELSGMVDEDVSQNIKSLLEAMLEMGSNSPAQKEDINKLLNNLEVLLVDGSDINDGLLKKSNVIVLTRKKNLGNFENKTSKAVITAIDDTNILKKGYVPIAESALFAVVRYLFKRGVISDGNVLKKFYKLIPNAVSVDSISKLDMENIIKLVIPKALPYKTTDEYNDALVKMIEILSKA